MLALILLLFFSFTGFLMNHEDAFGLAAPRTTTSNVTLPTAALSDKLALVELLRKSHGAVGELLSYDDSDAGTLRLQFFAPGRKIDYTINRADGTTEISRETRGFAGWAADLHTGKNAHLPWKLVIDSASALLFIAALTGTILWLTLPKRRKLGIAALAISAALCALVYFCFN
jgi:hypothetical protein